MGTIYEPKGKAREYSPLALNIYKGCNHGCFYCYVPNMMKRFNKDYKHNEIIANEKFLIDLEKTAKKYYDCHTQILLSFTTDLYNSYDDIYNLTSEALKILLKNKIPVAILTKGGNRALKDLELFKKFNGHIKVGTSLTFSNDNNSLKYEPGAAVFTERINMLKVLNGNGIKTWVSIEPVINVNESLDCILKSLEYTDSYKVGKLNHYSYLESLIDWGRFLDYAVMLLRYNKKKFYIKKDLQGFNRYTYLNNCEIDMDFLNIN